MQLNKYITLLTVFFCANIQTNTTNNHYEKLREGFKFNLYRRQRSLMAQDKYYAIIEPFLQKSEATLRIPQYLKDNNNPNYTYIYFEALSKFNVACFGHQKNPTDPINKIILTAAHEYFKSVLDVLKDKNACLKDLDIEKEAEETMLLLKEANELYYQQLSFITKFILKF